MKKKVLIAVASIAVLVALVGVNVVWFNRKVSNFRGPVELYVYPGTGVSEVLDSILASGMVKREANLRAVFKSELESVVPGHYMLDENSTCMYAARMLRGGWQTPVKLTLSGTIRSHQSLARKISARMMVDSAAVADFILNADSLKPYDVTPAMLFTRIIPDTYEIKWTSSVREIVDRLVKESDAWWTPERLFLASRQGLSKNEAVILASIVSGETRYQPEMPSIACVYLNRLKLGMKLQADPTVAFCFDYKPGRILKTHLAVDSPYNTYKHYGLPPGPIACPPKSCLEAVLRPDTHSYLYFCADPSFNGTHRFASTYTEHLNNANAFRKALTERQRNGSK